jgi:hypothetical protein
MTTGGIVKHSEPAVRVIRREAPRSTLVPAEVTIAGTSPRTSSPTSRAPAKIDAELVTRVRAELESAKRRRFVAVAIDIPDLEAMLAALGAGE